MNRCYKAISLFLLLFQACHAPTAPSITIATAANMQFAMQQLSQIFTQQSGIKCQLIVSSSGKLTAQIIEGAPFDILVAANKKYPEAIARSGLAAAPPKIYAQGHLVLWTMSDLQPLTLASLSSSEVSHIAIANPKTAPYGQAALELLQHYKLSDQIKHKLVYGESIAQTNQFITSKSAELGFTAKSVVLSSKMKGKGTWIDLDSAAYQPIEQGVVLVQQTNEKTKMAKKFYDFLSTPKAQEILENHGYTTKNTLITNK